MAEVLPDFQRTQAAFAAYIRDPEHSPRPEGVSDERMMAYRDLFFNNIDNFIATAFPVLRSLLSEEDWRLLIRDFYRRHRCGTPLFIEIAQEFLEYLSNKRQAELIDPPYLLELAHYEWVELALAVSEAESSQERDDLMPRLLDVSATLSPLAWPLAYQFPVHHIGPDFQPSFAGEMPTFLVVYRNREDLVRFMELNQVSYRLLQFVGQSPERTVREQLSMIAEELQHPEPGRVLEFGVNLIKRLHQKGVIGLCG